MERENYLKQIELNEDDVDFLKFLEAKLQKTEQKISAVQTKMRESNTFQAEKVNKKADEMLKTQKQFNRDELKGSIEENYLELLNKNKVLEKDMKMMVGKLQEKNKQINLLVEELKRSKESEELCIKKMAKMKMELENHSKTNQNINNSNNSNAPSTKKRVKNSQTSLNIMKTPFQQEIESNKQKLKMRNQQSNQNLKKEDKYNFWQQESKSNNNEIPAQNLQQMYANDQNSLWIQQHDLRKNYRQQQEQLLQQKYEQEKVVSDEQFQEMQQKQQYQQQNPSVSSHNSTPKVMSKQNLNQYRMMDSSKNSSKNSTYSKNLAEMRSQQYYGSQNNNNNNNIY